jgi:NAD(P)-dependent dehydrogenase (short-subunit alcohol dehydrogenase family)
VIDQEVSNMSGPLDGRVVIVTGGGRGLGRAYCLELGKLGASVVINDIGVTLGGEESEESPADEVARTVEDADGKAVVVGGSVTDRDAVSAMFARAIDEFGRIDGVVNNAGITRDRMLVSMSEEDFDRVIDVHVKGTFNTMQFAAQHWRERHKAGEAVSGRIVNTVSGSGLRGNIGQVNYGAAKAAIAAMTRAAAAELDRYGVTVNAIAPVARTRMTIEVGMDEQGPSGFDELAPENAAPLVAYLLSAQANWLTGQVLRPEGSGVAIYEPWRISNEWFKSAGGQKPEYEALHDGLRRLYGVSPGLLGQTGNG